MFGKYVDAPAANTENGFIPAEMWPIITREIMKQCDGLDGLVDGIISEPDDCILNLEHLVCGQGDTENCLNRAQFNALQNIYSPLRGSHEQELFSRYDPGAESNGQWQVLLGGNVLSISGVSSNRVSVFVSGIIWIFRIGSNMPSLTTLTAFP